MEANLIHATACWEQAQPEHHQGQACERQDDFSKCSSLIGSVIFARAAPGVNSTTSLAPNRGLANSAIEPGVGARLLRFLEAADERDELPAIII